MFLGVQKLTILLLKMFDVLQEKAKCANQLAFLLPSLPKNMIKFTLLKI